MAEIDPWDDILEALTTGLVAMCEQGRDGPASAGEPGGWRCELRGDARKVQVDLVSPDGAAVPGDYSKVILFNLSYHQVEKAQAPWFRKVLTIHEGYLWDQEMLREVALEPLGLLRHVFGATELRLLAEPVAPKRRFRRR